ncbi:MAG: hypothetical protein NZ895_03960 [Archaeoglobaceae archaeon]|nr:hypothetical protein [Archaeoglobaceae archaeon]MCX8152463.1 hypothetical protein [Archaeoglobaceae archaeon]MDW8013803.1 hypothetical protein [Archaeoglobaceae archaeon]
MYEDVKKILENFENLKRLLSSRALCEEDRIVICDEPLKIIIRRDRIDFYVYDEYHGFVSSSTKKMSKEVEKEAKLWLKALSSLKFRRFSVRP